MANVPSVKLNDGTSIPAIGFGTGTGLYRQEVSQLILSALRSGYRYLDTAQQYGNAESVGIALKKWEGKREDVYIVTKFGADNVPDEQIEPRKVLLEQLQAMGIKQVDLYLIHNPFYAKPNLQEAWKTMEQLQKEGLTKSIGVSNFREEDIQEIKKIWTIPPAVNQIEYNPYLFHPPNMLRLRKILDENDIKIEAYGPLNSVFRSTDGPVDPVVKKLAEKHSATEAQILLAWAHQYSTGVVVTTSRDENRQKEQLVAIGKVNLSQAELDEIAEAGKGRYYRHFQEQVWGPAKP